MSGSKAAQELGKSAFKNAKERLLIEGKSIPRARAGSMRAQIKDVIKGYDTVNPAPKDVEAVAVAELEKALNLD